MQCSTELQKQKKGWEKDQTPPNGRKWRAILELLEVEADRCLPFLSDVFCPSFSTIHLEDAPTLMMMRRAGKKCRYFRP